MTGTLRLTGTLVLTILSLPAFANGATLGGWFKGSSVGKTTIDTKAGGDLVFQLGSALEHHSDLDYQHAIAILDQFENMPSCARQSWSQLITTCSDLDTFVGGAKSTEANVRKILEVFATRLAVCELSAVGTDILPPACASLFTSQFGQSSGNAHLYKHKTDSSFTFGSKLHLEHEACLHELFQDSRFWISYSNSQQNARSICESSKKQVDKEEALHLHRSLLQTADTAQKMQFQNAENMEKFATRSHEIMEAFQTALKAHEGHIVMTGQEMHKAFAPFFKKVASASNNLDEMKSIINAIRDSAESTALQQDVINDKMNDAHAQYTDVMHRYTAAMNEFYKLTVMKTGQINDFVDNTEQSLAHLFPRVLEAFNKVDLTAGVIDSSLVKSHQIQKLLVNTTEQIKALAMNHEEAHNQTMASYSTFKAEFDKGLLHPGSLLKLLGWIGRNIFGAFHSMPTFAIAAGYFILLMSTMVIAAMAIRKLATLPLKTVAAPFRAIPALVSMVPAPIAFSVTVLSVYFGMIEQFGHFVARVGAFDLALSDAYFGVCVGIPPLVFACEQIYAATHRVPKDTYDEKLDF